MFCLLDLKLLCLLILHKVDFTIDIRCRYNNVLIEIPTCLSNVVVVRCKLQVYCKPGLDQRETELSLETLKAIFELRIIFIIPVRHFGKLYQKMMNY